MQHFHLWWYLLILKRVCKEWNEGESFYNAESMVWTDKRTWADVSTFYMQSVHREECGEWQEVQRSRDQKWTAEIVQQGGESAIAREGLGCKQSPYIILISWRIGHQTEAISDTPANRKYESFWLKLNNEKDDGKGATAVGRVAHAEDANVPSHGAPSQTARQATSVFVGIIQGQTNRRQAESSQPGHYDREESRNSPLACPPLFFLSPSRNQTKFETACPV